MLQKGTRGEPLDPDGAWAGDIMECHAQRSKQCPIDALNQTTLADEYEAAWNEWGDADLETKALWASTTGGGLRDDTPQGT